MLSCIGILEIELHSSGRNTAASVHFYGVIMSDIQSLSSSDSVRKIAGEISILVQEQGSPLRFKDIHHACLLPSALLWPFLILYMACSVTLIASPSPFGNMHVCGILLLDILLFNMIWAVFEVRKKNKKIVDQLRCCISELLDTVATSFDRDCLKLEEFGKLLKACDTAAILSSPSHSVSNVYKKEMDVEVLRHVPTTLLAAGDHILLCPGQVAPANLVSVKDQGFRIERGDILNKQTFGITGSFSCDTDNEICSERFEVLDSPIVEDIKFYLDNLNKSKKSEVTVFEGQRIYVLSLLMKFVIPALMISSCLVSVIKIMLLPLPSNLTSQRQPITSCYTIMNNSVEIPPVLSPPFWYTHLLQTPACLCIPLFPFFLHALCTVLITIGEAKTLSVYRITDEETARYVVIPNTLTLSSQAITMQNDDFREAKWLRIFRDLLLGNRQTVTHRTSGLFLPLGSLTVLCCLDKEGILSWLNPITEKVFFFKTVSQSMNLKMGAAVDEEPKSEMDEVMGSNQIVIPETLSLSQDSQDPSHLRFDDVNWKSNHSSLKPIGINIVLNLCSCPLNNRSKILESIKGLGSLDADFVSKIQNNLDEKCGYSQDNDILQSAAIKADYMPTGIKMARKGLCDLAEIIGIHQSVKKAYIEQKKITAYQKTVRQSSSQSTNPISCAVARQRTWKQCLPHFQGSVFEDLIGDSQLLIYGTGDLIIDQCKEIWSGHKLYTMTAEHKRKALDFYHRSSVAGQCIAFAYSPVTLNSEIRQTRTVFNLMNSQDMKQLTVDLGGEAILNNLIFLGMTTLQHQAKHTVCHMVDGLDRACIRFVHFSSDNEVRSQVFAEKMGLETGWNCHISLSPSKDLSASVDTKTIRPRTKSGSCNSQQGAEGQGSSKPPDEDDAEDLTSPSSTLLEYTSHRTQSESTATDSLFNVSNRAKLPRGVENIVPHIENIDNVPLLVPLFTDSTPETAGEMIRIMKQYGEVVCCVGSADCIRNAGVFPSANISIAIEPLLQPVPSADSSDTSLISKDSLEPPSPVEENSDGLKALEVARKLNSFTCSALLPGDNSLPTIMSMIMQARHFLFLIRSFFIFLGKCEITLTAIQLIAQIVLLPSPFTAMDVFWLSFIVFPCLSFSLFGSSADEDLMTWASEKFLPHQNPVLRSTIRDFWKEYFAKFFPSIVVLVLCYFLALQSSCMEFSTELISNTKEGSSSCRNSTVSVICYPNFLLLVNPASTDDTQLRVSVWDTTDLMRLKFRAIQMTISGFLVVYMCMISMGYVHRWKKMPSMLPFTNKFWTVMAIVLIILQFLVTISVVFVLWSGSSQDNGVDITQIFDFGSLQVVFWIVLPAWIVPCSLFNERWKWREINLWNRWQKRARLNFGTKLGMNSPF